MKPILLFFSSIVLGLSTACDKTELHTRLAAEEELRQLHSEITALANSVPCTDPSQWAITPLGSKACGGPVSYIAYPEGSLSQNFLSLVEHYTEAQRAFNKKYGLISDCMYVMSPSGIRCENNRAVFITP